MTPDAAFAAANLVALLSWTILAASPWLGTRAAGLARTIAGRAVPALFAAAYAVLVALHFFGTAGGGFSSIGSVSRLFANPCTAPDLVHFLEAIRTGGTPILSAAMAADMMRNQIGALAGPQPGIGFGFGGAVVVDPAAAHTPQSQGTWQWGGVYGHSWFVDPARKLTVVAFTNTALEGMWGRFTTDLRDAVYEAVK